MSLSLKYYCICYKDLHFLLCIIRLPPQKMEVNHITCFVEGFRTIILTLLHSSLLYGGEVLKKIGLKKSLMAHCFK